MKRTRVIREQGKVRFDLLPLEALAEVAIALDSGNQKPGRGPFNWLDRDIFSGDMIAGCFSHVKKYQQGEIADPESGAHPLAHAAARLLILISAEFHGRAIDERPGAKRRRK